MSLPQYMSWRSGECLKASTILIMLGAPAGLLHSLGLVQFGCLLSSSRLFAPLP